MLGNLCMEESIIIVSALHVLWQLSKQNPMNFWMKGILVHSTTIITDNITGCSESQYITWDHCSTEIIVYHSLHRRHCINGYSMKAYILFFSCLYCKAECKQSNVYIHLGLRWQILTRLLPTHSNCTMSGRQLQVVPVLHGLWFRCGERMHVPPTNLCCNQSQHGSTGGTYMGVSLAAHFCQWFLPEVIWLAVVNRTHSHVFFTKTQNSVSCEKQSGCWGKKWLLIKSSTHC